jgi:hypothetical protein
MLFLLEVVPYPDGRGRESSVQNLLDVGVVLPPHTPQVEIHDVTLLRVQNDEHAIFVSTQNNSILRLTFLYGKK